MRLVLGGSAALAAVYQLKTYMGGATNHYTCDLKHKTVLITGGNSGIGAETAKGLSVLGTELIITGRDVSKAKQVLQEIHDIHAQAGLPPPSVHFHEVDFADLHQVKAFAEEVAKRHPKLDVLLNNAGASYDKLRRGAHQTELTMLTNHLAPMYLTHLLLPLLRAAPQSRVINVASRAHARGENNLNPFEDSIQPRLHDYFFERVQDAQYKRELAYNHSKLANILFTKRLAQYLEDNKLDMKTVSLHPGVIRSPFIRGFSSVQQSVYHWMYPLMWVLMKDTRQGAQTNLAVVLIPYNQLVSGAYYSDCKVATSSKPTHNPEQIQAVWDISIDRIKQITGEKTIFGQ